LIFGFSGEHAVARRTGRLEPAIPTAIRAKNRYLDTGMPFVDQVALAIRLAGDFGGERFGTVQDHSVTHFDLSNSHIFR